MSYAHAAVAKSTNIVTVKINFMKSNKSSYSAFSLVELSIVILIIGILIAGVAQGTSLFYKTKLQMARALTSSSTVHGIKGLALWLETTSEQSFTPDQSVDEAQLYRWVSIANNISHPNYNAIKTANSSVTYDATGPINFLPAVYFNGTNATNSFFNISTSTSSANNTFVPTPNCNFTFFLVYRSEVLDQNNKYVFYNGTLPNNNGFGFGYFSSNFRRMVFTTINTPVLGSAMTHLTNEIISFVYRSSQVGSLVSWQPYEYTVNGVSQSSTISCNDPDNGALAYIGFGRNATTPWSGHIYEVIIFDRSLTNEEISSIRQYLGQKYQMPA